MQNLPHPNGLTRGVALNIVSAVKSSQECLEILSKWEGAMGFIGNELLPEAWGSSGGFRNLSVMGLELFTGGPDVHTDETIKEDARKSSLACTSMASQSHIGCPSPRASGLSVKIRHR